MGDRTKELILKTLLIIGIVLMFMLFPGGIFWSILIPSEEVVIVMFNIILFTLLGVGILYMILLPIFGGLKQKPVKAEKVPLVFASYNEFSDFLQLRLLQKEYQMQNNVPISPDGHLTVYLRTPKNWTLACFTIIRVPELSDQLLDNANESITNILTAFYGSKTITDTINMISVFCVDRITPAFRKLINNNIQQGLKNGRLTVGVSFGGKNIYISKQKDGFAIMKYKYLRKEFDDIIGIQNWNKETSILR
jgi:hypothetical protein